MNPASISKPKGTPQKDPELIQQNFRQSGDQMQQNVRQSNDQSNNQDQSVISFPFAPPHEPSSAGNANIPGFDGAINPDQYDIPGQLLVPEPPAVHGSDPKVFNNSHGTGCLCLPPADNTPVSTGAVAFPCPNHSNMMAAPNGPEHQIGHETFDFNPYQALSNGQGAFPLDFGQEALNFQGSFPCNSDQAGPSGHRLPVLDADQSGPNGHNPYVANSNQGDNNSQGPVISNPYQANPKGKGPLALSSEQIGPDSQGFSPANSDQAGLSIQDQIASIFPLGSNPRSDSSGLWRPMTVEDIASNPAAAFQYFVNFQISLQRSHELALEKVQKDYAIALEKFREDHTIALYKAQNSYAVALHQVNYDVEQYCGKLRAEMEYLRSDNPAKTQTIRDSRTFLENLNGEISRRGLRLSPALVTSGPITQEFAASGQMMGSTDA